MTDSFENVGILKLASTGRSYKLEYLGFISAYVSVKDVELVRQGKKKTATIFKVKRRE
ncbi:hypothetical protein KAU88_07605 [Candidatus Bathyarchaeota archaeon]|nr:hypothetical protein [Candidatus Bathyarchaeota archaeon]